MAIRMGAGRGGEPCAHRAGEGKCSVREVGGGVAHLKSFREVLELRTSPRGKDLEDISEVWRVSPESFVWRTKGFCEKPVFVLARSQCGPLGPCDARSTPPSSVLSQKRRLWALAARSGRTFSFSNVDVGSRLQLCVVPGWRRRRVWTPCRACKLA